MGSTRMVSKFVLALAQMVALCVAGTGEAVAAERETDVKTAEALAELTGKVDKMNSRLSKVEREQKRRLG